MRRAPRSSWLPGLLLAVFLAGGAHARQRPPAIDPQAARRQAEQAERASRAGLDAQQQAAARAEAAAAEAKRLAEQRVAAAARLRSAELATLDAASRIEALARRREAAEARLRARAADLAPLLPVIERLSLYPAETLLAVGAPPDAALRGVLVLQGIGRTLEQQARALRAEQAAVDAAKRAIEAEAPRLAAARAKQADEAASLDRQVTEAREREQSANDQAEAFARQAAAAAAQAKTLRGVVAEVEARRRAEAAKAREEVRRAERQHRPQRAAEARRREAAVAAPIDPGVATAGRGGGRLTAPVAGTVVRDWGDATEAGPATGLSYKASPGARVVSPCGGRAVFAAPFRSYGLLLILDCGGGYHVVLAGLERLDVRAGSPIRAGEPVGVMPDWDPRSPGAPPTLYVELRKRGRAINPGPWLRAQT